MSPSSRQSVVVIGGGVGGLSTACYLADADFSVTVLEKNEQLGGRASRLEADGFRFDMGPSWYLMPDVFERFFRHFGKLPSEYYELERLDPHYRIFFKDGDKIDITPDHEQVKEVFESYEEGAGAKLEAYLEESERNYEVAMNEFVYKDRPRLRDWVDPSVLKAAPIGLNLIGSMQGHVEDYFENPKLQQIMQYTLVFLGGSPKNTPALYNMMSHVDFNLGVYYPESGIGAVIDGMVELAEELGVKFVTDCEVTEVTRRREGFLVETTQGEYHPDLVVSDADYAHTEQDLLPKHERQYSKEYWNERTYAPSAFLLYLGVEGDVDELAHHTLVLPEDWDPHFEQIFDRPAWPDNPAYYLCVPSKTDDTVAPEGHSNLFALVPIAAGLTDTPKLRRQYRAKILDDIAKNTGVDLHERIVFEKSFCVRDFATRYNSTQGSALGLAHTLRQTALLRPPHRSKKVDGLYFTGSFTTPGIGVPMCLISGEHAANAVIHDSTL
ncbi:MULTISPECIES: NAD(P)/FAD-dependent oxidoreductase [unclassified Haladaptatus]|uniref:phytoene desaturase family protein n=1 Tax=unclassified Haladaptatus TaxID=2622732 RepID=UPI0023E7A488|nr:MULTISPECIES: phytoene desaturase family protein [unclassified Haladaptatus]